MHGAVGTEAVEKLLAGVQLDDGGVKFSEVEAHRILESIPDNPRKPGQSKVRVVLAEGRYHIVRRALASVGHPVRELHRSRVGSVRLPDLGLPVGQHVELNREAVNRMWSDLGVGEWRIEKELAFLQREHPDAWRAALTAMGQPTVKV